MLHGTARLANRGPLAIPVGRRQRRRLSAVVAQRGEPPANAIAQRDVENPSNHQRLASIDQRSTGVKEIENAGGRVEEQRCAVDLNSFMRLLRRDDGAERNLDLGVKINRRRPVSRELQQPLRVALGADAHQGFDFVPQAAHGELDGMDAVLLE